jgi:hypothetical protein
MKDSVLLPKDFINVSNQEPSSSKMTHIVEDEKESLLETDSFSGNDFMYP